jgi:hypothetical protein
MYLTVIMLSLAHIDKLTLPVWTRLYAPHHVCVFHPASLLCLDCFVAEDRSRQSAVSPRHERDTFLDVVF